ncbi:helix-turn-helix transcriptional regulator [Actomonas aquatica]|uniref:Helix-turn-helix transcriptional regulator n=1 Tax=Actomonas aquatica TaxID=2866162 RepID=A0ABZ1CAC1_9BACT|nr:helix-turn-helix transcriptional regulator [Opitutus sp. WL0086]WRQ87270.1 helix-turn-helix transcriptional regulator [Opitutus sp. WL0086]
MKIEARLTDEVILRELGARVAALRLERNLTQAELAREAGVSARTVARLESGEVAVQLSALLRVSRVLGLLERLDVWLPEVKPGPMQQLLAQAKDGRRRRASGKRARAKSSERGTGRVEEEAPGAWSWGDEA